jgi:hypothetical protein
VCGGDSGSGLVTTGAVPTLVGIVSAGQVSPDRAGCDAGSRTIFTSVWPPEVLRFIEGDDQPPMAPRRTDSTFVKLSWHGPLRAGSTLRCGSEGWAGQATVGYAFVDGLDGRVLQSGGRDTFLLTPAAVGATVFCSALASNDGGTAVLSTAATDVIAPMPKLGILPLTAVSAVRGRTATVRVVLQTGTVIGKLDVCVTAPTRVAGRSCASHLVGDGGSGVCVVAVKMKIKPTAPAGSSRLSIAVAAGSSRAAATAVLRIDRA